MMQEGDLVRVDLDEGKRLKPTFYSYVKNFEPRMGTISHINSGIGYGKVCGFYFDWDKEDLTPKGVDRFIKHEQCLWVNEEAVYDRVCNCGSEMAYHDKKKRWFCPFCEDE